MASTYVRRLALEAAVSERKRESIGGIGSGHCGVSIPEARREKLRCVRGRRRLKRGKE